MRDYLTEATRQEILAAWYRGVSGTILARHYGVSRNYASNLARERGMVTPKQLERRMREDRLWQRAKTMAANAP